MPPLSLRNIGKSFDGKPVLRDVSLDLTEGELFVLLGPSGCGKSTALRLIAGLEELDRGEIVLGDRRIDTLPPRERHVAMVFQNYALYPHMTVAKNLAFPLAVAGVPSDERRRRVQATVDMLGLGDRLNDRPAQLSGGQRQRVALGRAIIRQPELFLLDEPLSNLDADLRARMRLEIVKLQKQLCTTTVYVTHDQTEALTMADRVAVLNQGVLEQVGTPEELYREPPDSSRSSSASRASTCCRPRAPPRLWRDWERTQRDSPRSVSRKNRCSPESGRKRSESIPQGRWPVGLRSASTWATSTSSQ